ncbi:hypothetical protein AX15_000937 [Amanita polypyramis BW_CC]|nr:hypothetical protein AX15_000937 [Amanita polypyramis BW_CC]
MMLNAVRARRLTPHDVYASCLQVRASSTSFPLKYDVPYSPIVETVRKRIAVTHGLKSGALSDPQVDIYNSTLIRIRQAIKNENAQVVIDYWQHLKRNNLLHFLGAAHVEKISELLATTFMPTHGVFRTWDKEMQKMVGDIALRAADFCCTDALGMLMLLYIKHNDPDTIIHLYEKFRQSLDEKEEMPGAEEKNADSLLMMDLQLNDNSPPFHLGRVSVLLAVTVAHAMKNSFQAALDTCIATNIRFVPVPTARFLKKLEYDPALQEKMKLWIPRLDIAAQVSRPPSLSRRIVRLAEKQSVRKIEQLYQTVIDGLTAPDAFIAAHATGLTSTKKVAMTTVLWTSFLAGFMKCQRKDLAAKLWDDMTTVGISPDVSLWTALIDAYDGVKAVDDALASWNMMRAQNIKPNALAYRAVISALFNGRKPDMALRIFREYQRESQVALAEDSSHCLSVYNTVIHGLLFTHRIQEAKGLLRNMQEIGVTPDVVSYNTLLAHYGRRGDFRELASVVNDMANANLVGDVFSFSTILSALLKAGREDAPDIMIKLMKKQDIEPNVATYSAIIDHQMRGQEEQNVRAALLMLQRMELDPQIHPNAVTYTSILAGLYRNHELPREKVDEWIKDIVRRMKQRGIVFGLPTYHILIKACLLNPQPEGLQVAMGYYNEMKKKRIPLVHATWYILLAGLLQREEWAVAEEVVKDMFKTGRQPAGSLLELVSRIRKRLQYRE